ncbi:MAG: serine protease [Cellvibrionaceae bacterium]|nr:serine protease [Cellvibrionaceae bacterium]
MRIFFLCLALIGLIGCETAAIQDSKQIQTTTQLNQAISLPQPLQVVYHVDEYDPKEREANFYGHMQKAAKLVSSELFEQAKPANSEQPFHYLLRLKTGSNWDRMWGKWKTKLELTILTPSGEQVFASNTEASKSAGNLYDFNAVHNTQAELLKEGLISFLNQLQQQGKLQAAIARKPQTAQASFKQILGFEKAASSGSGFFVAPNGLLLTADHVSRECLALEVAHQGKSLPAKVVGSSRILDLAVLQTEHSNTDYAHISPANSVAEFGQPVFVTGFPLADILSPHPSITIGNISSLGGLKGAKENFQFSAPIQPGNSGSAIVDYKGRLVGLASSTLNQKMMLEKEGTTSQNVNFGVNLPLIKKFFAKHNISYPSSEQLEDFETASKRALKYTNQILCYK